MSGFINRYVWLYWSWNRTMRRWEWMQFVSTESGPAPLLDTPYAASLVRDGVRWNVRSELPIPTEQLKRLIVPIHRNFFEGANVR